MLTAYKLYLIKNKIINTYPPDQKMSSHQDIVQFNCCGIRAQYHHIMQIIKKYTPNFILLQELKIGFNDKVSFRGYKFIHNLKTGDTWHKSSVGILIKNGINFDVIDTPDDICVIGINTVNVIPLSIFSFYDNYSINMLNMQNLKIIEKAGKNKMILMGDFNARSGLWDDGRKLMPNDFRSKSIIEFVEKSNMIIMNDGRTTRISPIFNFQNSAIDLTIIHKDINDRFDWNVSDSDFGSDHLPTMITISDNVNFNQYKRTIFDLKTTNWEAFNDECCINMFELRR